MYPYPTRLRWFLFGRYSHLVRAVRDHEALQDPTIAHRISSIRTWNSARFAVSVLLAIGIGAALVSAIANRIPGANAIVGTIVSTSTALAGALSLLYLFLTRLLGQLEIDVLARLALALEPRK